MEYAKRMKAIRVYVGLTQDEMAVRLGVTARTIANYESGYTLPTVDVWDRINAMAPEMFCGAQR